MRAQRKRWVLLGGLSGATISAVVVSALAMFAGSGVAASTAKPEPQTPPRITGTPQEGQTLTGHNGTWKNNPSDFNFFWVRCNENGGNCSNISGAHDDTYQLQHVDVGNTLRFKVEAVNSDGCTFSSSVPTAVVTASTSPPPPPAPP